MNPLRAITLPLLLIGSLLFALPAQAELPPGVTPTQCGPAESGSPCGGEGPASQGNSSETNQGAGNPINVITGNKYQREIDLPALPGVLGLEIVRHYNSVHADPRAANGTLGRGWRLSYETDLYAIGNTLQIMQADGTRIIFIRNPNNPSQCATHNSAHGTVAIQKTPRGEEYLWTWTNGRSLSFNHQGRLTEIRAPTGEFVSLIHDLSGVLVKVTDPQDRSLVLGYPAQRDPSRFNGIRHIDSPVGRFSYAYGSVAPKGYIGNPRDLLANLVAVTFPNKTSRHYHYEDATHATLLTGLSVAGQGKPQRINTWAYDTQGRGILSVKGMPRQLGKDGKPVSGTGIEQVNLTFAPGKTTLTNSLGQKTTYTHAIVGNEYRLLDVRGPGCASCGESNVKYGYDKLGRLTGQTQLSPSGQPRLTTKTERDNQARPLRIHAVAYINGKAQPAQLQVRYEYAGATNQPSLIARPSVIPGREHQVRISTNALGQPTQVTETGFSPLDDKGQGTATPISRTTTYGYQTINGRSLLSQIDGPLKNGPKKSPMDSDITRIEWDGRGNAVVVMTPPGSQTSTVKYDAVGRIAVVSNADNFKTTFTYDAGSQLIQTSSSGQNWEHAGIQPTVQRYRYDALGHMIETGTGGQVNAPDTSERGEAEPYRPQTRQAYDVAGRLLWQAEALGILKRARYDTEGNLLSSTVQTRSFEQTEQYRYDALNRLVQVADNTGSVRNIVYGKSSNAQRPRSQSAFQTLKDDFGRTVSVISPSHGSTIKQYNAADQLIQQRNDKGDIQIYAYDLTGQRIRLSLIPKTGEPQTTTWRYKKGRLAEVVHPNQSERITYNERGQPAIKTVTLKLNSGAVATHITRYSYTADGSLQSQSLPDGTQINYERNGQGQVVAVSQQISPWTFFGWGKTTLVKDMERDLIGLRSVTYGNGIQGQWQRSKQGILARVVYTRSKDMAVNPARIAAASREAVRQPILESLLNKLLSVAYAQTQTPPAAASKLPGALGLPANPLALFDARLIYDGAGNVLLQDQQGQGAQHSQAYAYDRQSQLVAAQSSGMSATVKVAHAASAPRAWRYHYDRNGNRDLTQENVPVTEMGHTRKASYDPTSNALTTPSDLARETVWNAQGQLITIWQENKDIAHYRYNHHGLRVSKQVGSESTYAIYNDQRQRIADLDANGHITRQYLWLADQLIATLDAKQPKALRAPASSFFDELSQTAQALWTSLAGNEDNIAFVHVNHLDAPIAATDSKGKTLWQTDYAPYGRLIRTSVSAGNKPAYALALRLPGQWEDAESGLYYNDFRYYDPQAGRYLSPDPLGRLAEVLGSPNAYAYVNNNPLSYIDPWGLILFAFDGTENTKDLAWLAKNDSSLSNVWNFYDLYNDGNKRYITGVGVIHEDATYGDINAPLLDAGVAWSGPERIERMVAYFNDEADAFMDDLALMDVDIIGFSRGSAQARDFANRINANTINGAYRYLNKEGQQRCQKINFRFMGLWDTVLSDNWSGTVYNFNIVPGFQYVAQAVALNEFRNHTLPLGRAKPWDTHSWGGFPLESIMGGTVPFGQTRIERGFIGAHADIGGGFGPTENQLAQVALVWMIDQAEAAGVTMKSPPNTIIANPVIHDKSDAIRFGSPKAGSPIVNDSAWNNDYDIPTTSISGSGAEDREVRYRDDNGKITAKTTQRKMTGTGMTFADTEQFITYTERSDLPKNAFGYTTNQTGTIDMQGYLKWLNANGYNINLTVQ